MDAVAGRCPRCGYDEVSEVLPGRVTWPAQGPPPGPYAISDGDADRACRRCGHRWRSAPAALATNPGVWVILEGEPYRLVRHGHETIDGRPTRNHHPCRDCGVPVGMVHMLGCGIEQCPRCGRQYMSCDCDGSEDEPDAGQEWRD